MNKDNCSTHQIGMVDPDQIYGQHIVEQMMRKPEFSFLVTHYALLYQSIIPNLKLSIIRLSKHINIDENVIKYIYNGSCHRIRCQGVLNVLLINLENEQDYMQFCYHFSMISVFIELPYKMIAVFQNNGCWNKHIPIHVELSFNKLTIECDLHERDSQKMMHKINTPETQCIASYAYNQFEWYAKENFVLKIFIENGAISDKASNSSVSTSYQINNRRRLQAALVSMQSTEIEGATCSHTAYLITNTSLQRSSVATVISSRKQNIKGDTPLSSSIASASYTDIQHTDCPTDVNDVATTCTSLASHISITNMITATMNPSTVTLGSTVISSSKQTIKGDTPLSSSIASASYTDIQHTNCPTDVNDVATTCTSSFTSHTGITNMTTATINSSTATLGNIQLVRSKYASILQCLPTDYEKTLEAVQDHLTDEEVCLVLSGSNSNFANAAILDCLVEKANISENWLQLCDQLEKVMPLLNDPEILGSVIREFKARLHQNVVSAENQLTLSDSQVHSTQVLQSVIQVVKSNFSAILQCLPVDYEKTLQVVQDYLTDEHICNILSNSDYNFANKAILDSLIEKTIHTEDLFEFCNQLEKILPLSTNQESLVNIITQIRTGLQQSIHMTGNKIGNTLLSGSNGQLHIRSPRAGDLYNQVFSTIRLNSQALMLMKLHYTKLCDYLPQDYMRSVQVLMQYLKMPEEVMHQLTMMPSVELVNENIIGSLMLKVIQSDSDILNFCDIIERVLDTAEGKKFIRILKNKLLKTLDPTCVPVSQIISMTTNDLSSHMISVNHETSHTLSREIAKTSNVGNLQLQDSIADITRKKDSRPEIGELYHDVVPKYAIYWEGLGIKLGLKDHHIAVISQNHAFNPNRTTDCCKSMLNKWLEIDKEATWDKLRDAINIVSKKGGKYMKPPKLPMTFVSRPDLLEEMVTKICNVTLNLDCYATTLTVTGAGGFGKTTLVTALCYHPTIQNQFTNGFVFVELGPQASDPSVKLSQLYHLLTGKYLKQGDANHAEQEIDQLITNHYQNILVIIDDVWHVEDAEPIVKAFSQCKIVLTTRMNDVEKYIPTKERVTVGSMEPNEAVNLLTKEVIDSSKISDEDSKLLDDLAQEVHLWPLILTLIRGHLFHNLKHFNLSHPESIKTARDKLLDKGLTAFDKNNIESVNRSRNYAVKICIEITFEQLSQRESDNFKSLILATGVGNSLPTKVLHYLWNVPEKMAQDKVEVLWAYGLVKFSEAIIPPNNKTQHCIEVHAVISQYIIENIECEQTFRLSPYGGLGTAQILKYGLELTFQQSYGIRDVSSLTPIEYLKYTQSKIECDLLPYYLKKIDMRRVYEVQFIGKKMQQMQDLLKNSVNTVDIEPLFSEQASPILNDCGKLLKQMHKLSRELKQIVERHLNDKDYDRLIGAIENNCFNSHIGLLAQKGETIIRDFVSYCEPVQLSNVMKWREHLLRITPAHDMIPHKLFPYIKLHVELHQKISNAWPSQIEVVYQYCTAGKYEEEFDLIHTNYLIKLQEVASSLVH